MGLESVNQTALIADLLRDEGLRLYVYDDANGQPIRPGYTLKGHPTIGIGRALDVHGISRDEAEALLSNDIEAVYAEITQRLPWFSQLDDARQRALCNVAFNVGVSGLLQFHEMLAALNQRNYRQAAKSLLESKLGAQSTSRAQRLALLLESPLQNV